MSDVKLKRLESSLTNEECLSQFETKELIRRYKFGVLYVKEGQTDESEIYSNTEYSQDFNEFLDFIGTRVELKGFEGFSGGLDTKRKLNEVSRKILTLS